jgi:hypothetical protein
MHDLEPYYGWRDFYIASEDPRSPFYEREYSEFEFTHQIYNHLIHPQWDSMDSQTLFIKILFVDYDEGFAFIELIGEWNDLLYNDIMLLKREIADSMMQEGIYKFILIGENVLNFHASDDCYYEEWFEDVNTEAGWIAMINFRDHVHKDMCQANIDQYFLSGGNLQAIDWRTFRPDVLYQRIEKSILKRIG